MADSKPASITLSVTPSFDFAKLRETLADELVRLADLIRTEDPAPGK
jgi:hypothetical protein